MRGSVTAVLDPNGTHTAGYQYDEFGNTEKSGDSSFYNEMEFTGAVSDTSSGLYYMNARYYNPTTGRFLSQDAAGGDAWTNNLYSYCGNNPVNFIDPTGYEKVWIENEGWFWTDGNGKYVEWDKWFKKHLKEQHAKNDAAGRTSTGALRDWAGYPDLDSLKYKFDPYRETAYYNSYNCLGSTLLKDKVITIPGYEKGMSTRETFELFMDAIGNLNAKEVTADYTPGEGERIVSMKNSGAEYHFIGKLGEQWLNKNGMEAMPVMLEDKDIMAEKWYRRTNSQMGMRIFSYPAYAYETIFIAVKDSWDD